MKRIHNVFVNPVSPKWLPSPEYAKKFNVKWYKVFEQRPNRRPPVLFYGDLKVDVQRRLDAEFPEIGVLEIQKASIYGENGWIFSREGYLLPDHSWYGQHVEEMQRVPRFIPRARQLEGICLSLASDFSVGGYGHFLTDCLPRLEIFRKAGFHLTDVDYIICPRPTKGNAQRLFAMLDIPESKCIWTDQIKALRPNVLFAPTFPGLRRNYQHWVPEFLQQEFLPSPPQPSRRLFVSRCGFNRNPINAESVRRILISHNFEIYDPMQHPDSHRDFSEAKIVVGASGSGLTGLAFCQPGTKVLELVPTDHVYPYYYTLSDAASLNYGCLVCRSVKERGLSARGPSPFDFYVDEEELENALVRLSE